MRTPFCDSTSHRGALESSQNGRGVFTFGEDTHTLRLKSELFDLRVGYANPTLRLGESQRGVRILSYRSKRNKKTTELLGLGCPFIWRRKRDSILARTTRSVFLGRGRPLEVRSIPIPLRIPHCKKRNLNQTARVRFRLLLAQREGFEPSCGVIHKLISSQPRYDRFDTSA